MRLALAESTTGYLTSWAYKYLRLSMENLSLGALEEEREVDVAWFSKLFNMMEGGEEGGQERERRWQVVDETEKRGRRGAARDGGRAAEGGCATELRLGEQRMGRGCERGTSS